MANFLPFRFSRKDKDVFKAVIGGDTLHIDEQGRHLIFRNINGRVRPIRVSAEEFAEWLSDQSVTINPADQKTLRELDKELQIMERAAEYGGPALQKQYEDYFNQKRQQYTQISQQYYQQALANQAKYNKMTPEQLQQRNERVYKQGGDVIHRDTLDARGWDTSLQMWVASHDKKYNLTNNNTNWYHNRIMAALVYPLIDKAKSGTPLSEINIDNMFSDEYVAHAMKESYHLFFGGPKLNPKQVLAAIRTIQKQYKENIRDNKNIMSNFINYWYGRMSEDFSRERDLNIDDPSLDRAMKEIPEGIVPKELPKTITPSEGAALMGMYNKTKGSKLNAAHRVIIHGMGRIVDSIPLNERVMAAVELSNGKSGLHAVHKEGYKRVYTDYHTLGILPNRDELVAEAVSVASKMGQGTTKQKIAALKRISMIMGAIDGVSTLNSNPGIQETQFTRKWNDVSVNALRVRSEGPGLIETLLDDEKRASGIYTNQDLKIIHKVPGAEEADSGKSEPKTGSKKLDLGDGYTFSGKKMLTPDGYSAEFSPTNQGYATVKITPPNGAEPFESRVYMPPISLSDMTEEDKYSYLESMKSQIGYMIKQHAKNNPPASTEVSQREDTGELSPTTVDTEGASFRIPIFDFNQNLTHEDRGLLGDIIQHVDEGGLDVQKTSANIFRVTNPSTGKFIDILYNAGKKKLMFAGRDDKNNIVPFQEPNIEDFAAQIGYKVTSEAKNKVPESEPNTNTPKSEPVGIPKTTEKNPETKPYDDPEGITVRSKNGTFKTPRVPGQERINPNRIFINFDKAIKPEDYDLIYGLGDLIGHGLDYEYTSKPGMYRVVNKDNTKYLFIDMDDETGRIQTWLPGENDRIILQGNADLTSIIDELDFELKPLPEYR
jgi:hypothetical protein